MAGEPIVEFVGRLVRDPELTHIASGVAVANFSVAVTPRLKNRHTDAWEDGVPLFFECAAWRDYAEHIAATYAKGTHIWVRGRLVDDSYERDGQTVRRWKVDVDETGPTLRFTTATLTDARASTGGGAAFRAEAPAPPVPDDRFAPPF
jgi:single-strand DNA-binding protein